jgi:hypothetical protein
VLRSLVGLLPSVLVGVSVMVIVSGVLRWWAGAAGARTGWSVILSSPAGTRTDLTFSVVLAIAMVCGLLTLWWGPGSVLTRDGARRTFAAVAPGRGGSSALVLLSLAGAALLVLAAMSGTAIVWWPVTEPLLPRG